MHGAEGVDERRRGRARRALPAGPAGPTSTCSAEFDSPTLKSPVTMTGSDGIGRAAMRCSSSAVLFSRDGCDS